ncbi:GAF domain-containing sensor histidine kinase [Cellulosimicrobium marinum]|uniref:GAF domain-containing sensor histidine kinase n=1 Tax=Cellulosimicrobium marinum TaxID=1638992 RepID=UPI001E4F8022|nr:GAF domain-containing protein [Cellulosimicrobium marinum]MCB7135971.1 GAF domain-containing protein [Cellulosimicrobium marinum]
MNAQTGPRPDVGQRVLDAVVAVTSDLDLEVVLRRIVAAAMDLTGARYGALGVLDPSGRERLTQFLPLGLTDDEVAAIDHWPHGEGLLGELIDHPEPIRVPEIADDVRSAGFPEGHPPMHTFLGVPVRVRDTVFGNLYLTDTADGAPFDDEDEAAVVALAAAAGVAIENARLYGRAKQVGVLEDRDRIARDLHDVVIQRLFASAMSLMSVQPLVVEPAVRSRIEETVSDLDETIRQIRSTIFALHTAADPDAPSIEDRLRAQAAAATTVLGFAPDVDVEVVGERSGAGVTEGAPSLPAEIADQLVVVLGESLTNVARHAGAHAVHVHLRVTAHEARLTVTDDGVGIRAGGRRSGLRNMAARASSLGGGCTVTALPDAGTRLEWWAPLG